MLTRLAVLLALLVLPIASPPEQTRVRLRLAFPPEGGSNQPPQAAVTYQSGFYVGDNFVVSTTGTQDVDGTIASGEVDWGDGNSTPITGVPAATYTHVYASADTYTVTLSVTDDDAAEDSAQIQVTVHDLPTGGSGNEYFETISAFAERTAAWSLRTQAELDGLVNQSPSDFWTYDYPSHGTAADCKGGTCDGQGFTGDVYGTELDAARLRKPPRAEFTADGYTRTAYNGPCGNPDCGDENVPGSQIPRLPLGNFSTGSVLITWDVWWSPETQSNKGTSHTWKSFFLYNHTSATGTGGVQFFLTHDQQVSGDITNAATQAGSLRVGPGGVQQNVGVNMAPGVDEDDPYHPPGENATINQANAGNPNPWGNPPAWIHASSKWHRYWLYIETADATPDWTSWEDFQIIREPSFTWPGCATCHQMTFWIADETRGPTRVLYKVPATYLRTTGSTAPYISNLRLSFDNSTHNLSGGGLAGPMIVYIRNAVVLRNYTPSEANSSFFARPVP